MPALRRARQPTPRFDPAHAPHLEYCPVRPDERLLLWLSRDPASADYADAVPDWTLETALDHLLRAFPDFQDRIRGKACLDFGCGGGWQSVALARAGARWVLGVDTNPKTLQSARALAARQSVSPATVEFAERLPEGRESTFDVVISQNSMEHFADPAAILQLMRRAVHPRGEVLITFGSPWLSPYGSHMHFFTKVPWVNVLFPERTVLRVRSRFRSDGALRYEDVESGLNRMTVGRFERLIHDCGMAMSWHRYRGVKGLDFLGRLPLLREFFINDVSAALRRV